MRMFLAGLMLALAVVLSGCTSQDVKDRAENLRQAATGLDTAAAYVSAIGSQVEAGNIAFGPLLDQVRVWLPERAAQLDALVATGANAPQILAQVEFWLAEKAGTFRESATALEDSASDDAIGNALYIGGMILAGFLGLQIPNQRQRTIEAKGVAKGAQLTTISFLDGLAKEQAPAPIPPMTPEEVRARHGVGGGA